MSERQLLLFSGDLEAVRVARETLEPIGFKLRHKQKVSAGVRSMTGEELVLVDVEDAMEAIREIKAYHPEATVMVAGCGEHFDEAYEEGAYHCLERPIRPLRLRAAVRNAQRYLDLKGRLEGLQEDRVPKLILGGSPAMRRVLEKVRKLAGKDLPLLISGEKGTGREMMAESLHYMSRRRSGPFITIKPSRELSLDELFGNGSAGGRLLQAEGGTVFFKDTDLLTAEARDRLIGLALEGRLNGSRLNVRVVCSINGISRSDPFARCFGALVRTPALRERTEDIVPLAEHFLEEAAKEFGAGEKKLTADARKYLLGHVWPGNISELKNTVRKACLLSTERTVESRHLASGGGLMHCSIREFLDAKLGKFIGEMVKLESSGLHTAVITEVEKSLIELVLHETRGNQVRASKVLGLNRTTLRSKIKTYGIKVK